MLVCGSGLDCRLDNDIAALCARDCTLDQQQATFVIYSYQLKVLRGIAHITHVT